MVKDPNELIETKKKTKLPSIIRWNLVKPTCQEFIKRYDIEVFNSFQCQQQIDPLLSSQLCVYYYTDINPAVVSETEMEGHVYTEAISTNNNGKVVYKKEQKFFDLKDGPNGHSENWCL